jgi:hypothetical protein
MTHGLRFRNGHGLTVARPHPASTQFRKSPIQGWRQNAESIQADDHASTPTSHLRFRVLGDRMSLASLAAPTRGSPRLQETDARPMLMHADNGGVDYLDVGIMGAC